MLLLRASRGLELQELNHILHLLVQCHGLKEELKVDQPPLHQLCLRVHQLLLRDLWNLDLRILRLDLAVAVLHVLIPSEYPVCQHIGRPVVKHKDHLLALPLRAHYLYIDMVVFLSALEQAVSKPDVLLHKLYLFIDFLDQQVTPFRAVRPENEAAFLANHLE